MKTQLGTRVLSHRLDYFTQNMKDALKVNNKYGQKATHHIGTGQ